MIRYEPIQYVYAIIIILFQVIWLKYRLLVAKEERVKYWDFGVVVALFKQFVLIFVIHASFRSFS